MHMTKSLLKPTVDFLIEIPSASDVASPVAINLFISVFTNIGMVSGLMPIVGTPLPLISYGGTAFLSSMISFGLLLNVEINCNSKMINYAKY